MRGVVDPQIWLARAKGVASSVLADEPMESWRGEMQAVFDGVFSLPDDLTEPFRFMYGTVTEIEKPRYPIEEADRREIDHYQRMLREEATRLLARA
jgi:hypothetical protein